MEGERFLILLPPPPLHLSLYFHVLLVPGLISLFFFLSMLRWAEPSHMCRNVLMNPSLWSGCWEAEVVSLAVLAKLTLKFKYVLPRNPWQSSFFYDFIYYTLLILEEKGSDRIPYTYQSQITSLHCYLNIYWGQEEVMHHYSSTPFSFKRSPLV